jgi:hypothetical protein
VNIAIEEVVVAVQLTPKINVIDGITPEATEPNSSRDGVYS